MSSIVEEAGGVDSGQAVTSEVRQRIIEWCGQYGLLGILHQRVETVIFPPRVIQADSGSFDIWQGELIRTPGGWQSRGEEHLETEPQEYHPREPGVWWHPISSLDITREEFETGWGRFFPSVTADDFSDVEVLPDAPTFFEQYQEPLRDFLEAAAELTVPILALGRRTKDETAPRENAIVALACLSGIASATRSRFRLTSDGEILEHWVAPNLLSALAMKALRDMAGGHEFLRCENHKCRGLFTSRAYQARYCSTRCRGTVNKRVQRRNKHVRRKTQPPNGRAVNRRKPR
ncbi:MAG: hypothetical protein H0U67_02660 [Gemmatimonadetes bacterium]|nr:hypothetical protein [Gemmatimonadota bacterium]